MGLSNYFKTILGLALIPLTTAQTLPGEDCALDPYATSQPWGSPGDGVAFCASKWKSGLLVSGIEIQGDHNCLRGLTVTFSDNSFLQFGTMDFPDADPSQRQKIEIDPTTDTFTRLQMWDNGYNANDNLAIGSILLQTSNQGQIDLSTAWQSEVQPLNVNLGSGMLLGIAGRAGDSLDRLEFIFAGTQIATRSIENLELKPSIDEINAMQSNSDRGFAVEYLDDIHHVNNLDTPTQVILRGEKKLSTSTSITSTSSDTFHLGVGFSFTIEMGVPLVAEGSLTTTTDMFWEHTTEHSSSTTQQTDDTKVWQEQATANPGQAIHCYAWAFAATSQEVTWTGTVNITFEDGNSLVYPSQGKYNTAQYSRVSSGCEAETVEDANAGANETGAKVVQHGKRRRSIGGGSVRVK